MVLIQQVQQASEELDLVKDLFVEYSIVLNEDLCFQSFQEEVDDPLKKYGEPHGSLFLARVNGEAVGCIALQPLQQEGMCEMKRLYVKPAFQEHGIGKKLVEVLLQEATKKGYKIMLLDTLDRLQPAMNLYLKFGFRHTSSYYQNPLKGVVYMQKDL